MIIARYQMKKQSQLAKKQPLLTQGYVFCERPITCDLHCVIWVPGCRFACFASFSPVPGSISLVPSLTCWTPWPPGPPHSMPLRREAPTADKMDMKHATNNVCIVVTANSAVLIDHTWFASFSVASGPILLFHSPTFGIKWRPEHHGDASQHGTRVHWKRRWQSKSEYSKPRRTTKFWSRLSFSQIRILSQQWPHEHEGLGPFRLHSACSTASKAPFLGQVYTGTRLRIGQLADIVTLTCFLIVYRVDAFKPLKSANSNSSSHGSRDRKWSNHPIHCRML